MSGFFTSKQLESKSRPNGKPIGCTSCGLHRTVTTKMMQPYGNFGKRIMNIGEAPGEVEDSIGKPFQGKTGNLLQHVYGRLGIDLFEDCINLNETY
jgi:uracil-DNA glycosylase family 4